MKHSMKVAASRNVKTHVTTGPVESKAWVEIAPGVSFGAHSYPSLWNMFWTRVLLGWKWRRTREPQQ